MMKALDVAVGSLNETAIKPSKNRLHKFAAAASGALGGAFGLAALAFELPVSTTIMLRSIADIAKSEGENIQYIDTKLACLTVFALGGRTRKDDATESGYFAARAAMASAVTEAAKYLAEKGFTKAGAPALVRAFCGAAAGENLRGGTGEIGVSAVVDCDAVNFKHKHCRGLTAILCL